MIHLAMANRALLFKHACLPYAPAPAPACNPHCCLACLPALADLHLLDFFVLPLSQLFIFFTIKVFGSLVNTLICTTRKFFNILISVVWNANPLLTGQWVAVFMVFVGLIASSLAKTGHGHKVKKH